MPTAWALRSASSRLRPVISTSLGQMRSAIALMRLATSMPSISGICQSSVTASKPWPASSARRKVLSATGPQSASATRKLMPASARAIAARACSLSSTTSTRLPRRCAAGSSARGWRVDFCRRSVSQKVAPWPGVLSTPTLPPISSARRLEIASPRPVPP